MNELSKLRNGLILAFVVRDRWLISHLLCIVYCNNIAVEVM